MSQIYSNTSDVVVRSCSVTSEFCEGKKNLKGNKICILSKNIEVGSFSPNTNRKQILSDFPNAK